MHLSSSTSGAQVNFLALERVAPTAVNAQTLGVSAVPNRIEMQWQGSADDPNGSGLWAYTINRDGVYFGQSFSPNFVDETVAAGTTHTYQIWAVDRHGNASAALSSTLTAAPAGTTEPRRIGDDDAEHVRV